MQRDRVGVIRRFFGEAIGEAGKTAQTHAHGEVLALGITRGNTVGVLGSTLTG